MVMRSVSARFDGEKVLFDEDVRIPPNSRLVVTILEDVDHDRQAFHRLAGTSFADAFGDDEVVYTEEDIHP